MNAITHPVEPEQVMALVDGELRGEEAMEVSAHIAECAECSSLAAQLREASAAIAEWHVAPAPKSVEETVAGYATRASLGLRIAPRQGAHRLWNWKRWAAFGGAAAALTVLALAISLSSIRQERVAMDRLPIEGLSAKTDALEPAPPAELKRNIKEDSAVVGQRAGDEAFSLDGPAASPADSNGALGGVIGGNPAQMQPQAQPNPEAPMIARTVSLSIVVKDFAGARKSLDAILARHQGYAAQMSVSTPEGSARSLQASLRVPAPMLAAAVADLRTLGRVENEAQSGEEVTRQHEDLVARLKTARETEERFRAILSQRTGTVSDVLQVEEGIARVRGEIEQMEAEQKSLEHRVDFATIELQLTEEYKAELNGPESAGTRMHNAFVAGFQNVGGTVLGIILFAEEFGPVLLVWAAILAVPVIVLRKRYKKALATAE